MASPSSCGRARRQPRAGPRTYIQILHVACLPFVPSSRIAAEAAHPSYQPETYEAAETTLRREWKGEYDTRLNRARTLMRDMARKHPAVAAEVRKLGLDNSARFIAAVEKAARRRGR